MARTTKYLSRTFNTSINQSAISNVTSFSYSEMHYSVAPSKMARVDVLGYAFKKTIIVGPSYGSTYTGSASYDATLGNLSVGIYHGLVERSFSGIFSALSWNVVWNSYNSAPNIFNLNASAYFSVTGASTLPAGHYGAIPGLQVYAGTGGSLYPTGAGNISGPSIVSYWWTDYANIHGNMHPAIASNQTRSVVGWASKQWWSSTSLGYSLTSGFNLALQRSQGGTTPIVTGLNGLLSASTGLVGSYISSVGYKRHFYMGPGESLYINISQYLSTAGTGKTLFNYTSISYSLNFLITEEDI